MTDDERALAAVWENQLRHQAARKLRALRDQQSEAERAEPPSARLLTRAILDAAHELAVATEG
jgi:hypothetical protein